MSSEFIARKGLIVSGSAFVSAAVTSVAGFTGSLYGTASAAQTSSYISGTAWNGGGTPITPPSVTFESASYALTSSYTVKAETFNAGNASNINAGTLNNSRLPTQINVTGVTGSLSHPAIKSYDELVNDLGNIGYQATASYNDGNIVKATVTGSVTMSIIDVPSNAATMGFYFTQNGTGDYQVAFSSSVSFGDVGVPTYSSANKTDIVNITTLNGGTKWIATYALGY